MFEFTRGMSAYNKKNFERAFLLFTKAAQKADPSAHFMLGHCYHKGYGTSIDAAEAMAWYEKALDGGDNRAQKPLQQLKEAQQQKQKEALQPEITLPDALPLSNMKQCSDVFSSLSIAEIRLRAEQGDANAQAALGDRYYSGQGIERNDDEAMTWYRKAADQGHPGGQAGLGNGYRYGRGIRRDFKQAMEWYSKSALQGHPEGQTELGDHYLHGYGVKRDRKAAMNWYNKAIAQGHYAAQYGLGKVYIYGGDDVTKNPSKGLQLITGVAERGNAEAQRDLGYIYLHGSGGGAISRNYALAIDWYRQAAEQGHAQAQHELGECYHHGYYEVTQDQKKAMFWFRKSAQQGYGNAKTTLRRIKEQTHKLNESLAAIQNNTIACIDWQELALNDSHVDLAVKAFTGNHSVTEFSLRTNRLSEAPLGRLIEGLLKHLSLKKLAMRCYGNPRYPAIGTAMSQTLSGLLTNNESLLNLDLSNNYIRDPGAKALATLLKHNRTLLSLNLEWNDISQTGIQALCEALTKNSSLTSLNLKYNKARGAVEALAQLLQTNSTLMTLDLRSTGLNSSEVSLVATALVENTSLTELVLDSNNINNTGMEALAMLLKKNATLQTLSLRNCNNFTTQGLSALAKAVEVNSTLSTLACNIDAQQVHLLAEALQHNRGLTSLNFSADSSTVRVVGDEGAEALAAILAHNTTLQTLSLSENGVGDNGGIALANALHRNRTITHLDITGVAEGNQKVTQTIGQTGTRALAAMLKNNSHLTTLCLGNNQLLLKELMLALHNNKTLTHLDVGVKETLAKRTNSFGGSTTAMAEMLKANRTLTYLTIGGVLSGVPNTLSKTDPLIAPLAEALATHPTLTHLIFRPNFISGNSLVADLLLGALKTNSVLTHVSLINCVVTEAALESLIEVLETTNHSLLTLNYGYIQGPIDHEDQLNLQSRLRLALDANRQAHTAQRIKTEASKNLQQGPSSRIHQRYEEEMERAYSALLESIQHNKTNNISMLIPIKEKNNNALNSGQALALWKEESTQCINALAALPDGSVVSGGHQMVRRWELTSGQCIGTGRGHKSHVYALAVLPDGSLLAGGAGGEIRRWHMDSEQCLSTWEGHQAYVLALAVLPDGSVVSGSQDKTIRHWNTETGKCIGTWEGHTDYVTALAVLPDGSVVSGSKDRTVRRWETTTGQPVGTWKAHLYDIYALSVLPNGVVVVGSQNKAIQRWKNGWFPADWKGHTSHVTAMAVLPDGTLISGSKDKTIRRWNSQTGECISIWEGHTDYITALAVLPDGSVVSGSKDKTIRRWPAVAPRLTAKQLMKTLEVLKNNLSVTTVTLNDAPLPTGELLSSLAYVVASHPSLTTLRLDRCGLTDHEVPVLLQALQAPQCKVKVLSLAGNRLSSDKLAQLQSALTTKLSGLTQSPQLHGVKPSSTENVTPMATNLPTNTPSSPDTEDTAAVSTTIPPMTSAEAPLPPEGPPAEGEFPMVDPRTGRVQLSVLIEPEELVYEMVMDPRTQTEERQCIGQGGFGAVYKGTWRHQTVAVKELALRKLTAAAEKEFMNEVQLMLQLRVSQVVALYGISLRPRYRLVMAYCEGGSLFDHLHSDREITWRTRVRLALEIAQGLAFLHACKPPILHRDLKSQNILLDEAGHAKLADFGLSRVKQEIRSSQSKQGEGVGTVGWMAPELFKRRARYELGSDMYSYGMILWELSSRQIPWSDAHSNALIIQWVSQGDREDIPPETPLPLARLIKQCWESDLKKRPTAEQALAGLKQLQESELIHSSSDNASGPLLSPQSLSTETPRLSGYQSPFGASSTLASNELLSEEVNIPLSGYQGAPSSPPSLIRQKPPGP